MKKYISVILSLLMIFSVVQSFSAVTDEKSEINYNTDFEYTLKQDGKIKIENYLPDNEICHIPETIDGYDVDELDSNSIPSSVKTLYVPNNIKKISVNAFDNATELDTLYVDCTNIDSAFNNIPKLKNLYMQDNVKNISRGCFSHNKKLETVIIGKNVEKVDDITFHDCSKLNHVEFLGDNTQLGVAVFYGCPNLVAVKLPNRLETLEIGTFEDCYNLSFVRLPSTLKSIKRYALKNCYSLKEINIPKNLTYVGVEVFYGCKGLNKIKYDAINLTDYEMDFFSTCKNVTTIEIGSEVQSIPTRLCNGLKNLETVVGGENVISTGSSCFANTKWEKSQEDGPIYIGKTLYKLKGNDLDSVTIQKGTVSIGNWALANKKLTEINLPSTLEYIGDYGIYSCYSLENIKLPDSLTTIGKFAFSNCGLLRNVTLGKNIDTIDNNAFQNCNLLKITGEYNSIGHIGNSAFYNCQSMTSFNFGKNLTTLGDYAFYGCKKLTNVTLDNKVSSIGRYSFAECKRIEKVTIGDNVTEIGENAFSNNTALTEVVGGDNVVEIGNKAFYNNTSLTSFKIGEKVTTVGDSAFNNCTSLSRVSIPTSLKEISPKMFYNCTSLENITLPDGVIIIGYGAFYNVKQTYYYMPETITLIENNAFYPTNKVALIGNKDSKTESYANSHNIKFVDNKSLPPVSERNKALKMKSGDNSTLALNFGKPLIWSTSNSKIATVKNGAIVALQKGTANIVARYDYDISITYHITVSSSPKLSKSKVTVKKGKISTLKVYGKSGKISNQFVNSKYAKFTSNKNSSTIKVKGLKKGKSTLKIKVNGVKVLPLTVVVK